MKKTKNKAKCKTCSGLGWRTMIGIVEDPTCQACKGTGLKYWKFKT